ncbi:MAG: hypothetical protein J2P36_16370 [Ktedonobacteraceae bacterium]|nr:hypothetical protein [Ktedonobacteraceae bacterium]
MAKEIPNGHENTSDGSPPPAEVTLARIDEALTAQDRIEGAKSPVEVMLARIDGALAAQDRNEGAEPPVEETLHRIDEVLKNNGRVNWHSDTNPHETAETTAAFMRRLEEAFPEGWEFDPPTHS